MSETKLQKIDFNCKDKIPFLVVYFVAVYMLMIDGKLKLPDVIPEIGIPIYVTTLSFFIALIFFIALYFLQNIISVTKLFRIIHYLVIDCKDNIIAIIIINTFFINGLVIRLESNYKLPHLVITIITILVVVVVPLGFTQGMVIIHNRIIDRMSNHVQRTAEINEKEITEKQSYFYNQPWFTLTLTILIFWLAAGVFLLKIDDDNLFSDWINSAVAIGTIALAIFGWMAYRYAIPAYIKQYTTKLTWNKKFTILTISINHIEHDIIQIKNRLNPIVHQIMENTSLTNYNDLADKILSWIKIINEVIIYIDIDIAKHIESLTLKSSELSILGVSDDLIASIILSYSPAKDKLQEYKMELKKINDDLIYVLDNPAEFKSKQKFISIGITLQNIITFSLFDNELENLKKVSRKILNT